MGPTTTRLDPGDLRRLRHRQPELGPVTTEDNGEIEFLLALTRG
jgi:hypothetical protein